MNIWQDKRVKVLFSLICGLLAGKAFLAIAPMLSGIKLIALVFPLVLSFCLLLFISPVNCFIFLLLVRPSLEQVFQSTRGPSGVGLGALCNIVMILLAAILAFRRSSSIKDIPGKKSWFFFLIFMGISAFYSVDKIGGVKLTENFISCFAVFSAPFFLINNDKDRNFWYRLLFSSFLISALAALLDFTGAYSRSGRLGGTFSHPNILAFYLVLGVCVIFYGLNNPGLCFSAKQKSAMKICAMLLLVQLVFTKTRNAWIALWLMAFVYGMLKDRRLIIACFICVPLALILPPVRERMFELYQTSGRSLEQGMNSWEWRLEAWRSSFSWIAKRPIFGYGAGSFAPLSVNFFPSREGIGAHNTYLQLLFEGGLLGLCSFLILFKNIWGEFLKAWKKSALAKYAIAIAYLISYLLVCLGDNLLYYLVLNWYLWFFAGFVLRERQLDDLAACKPRPLERDVA